MRSDKIRDLDMLAGERTVEAIWHLRGLQTRLEGEKERRRRGGPWLNFFAPEGEGVGGLKAQTRMDINPRLYKSSGTERGGGRAYSV